MNDFMKILLSSSVVSGIVGGGAGWFTTSQRIEQELHSKQSASGYEALINANSLNWQSEALKDDTDKKDDKELAADAEKLKRKSNASYQVAQLKIATFGDELVVKAMSDYYYNYGGAWKSCPDIKKYRTDVKMYKAIRDTLGVGGNVTEQQLATMIFQCSLEEAGNKLYKTHCSACHGNTGGVDMQKRVAPPIAAVRMHYIGSYPDRDSFVLAVADWVEKQDESNSLMRGAIRRFNLMPPVSISRGDAEKIASYIFDGDIEKPAGFDEHAERMHGKKKGM